MSPAERIIERLKKYGEELSHADVCIVFDVTHHTVEAWRESGEFTKHCINKSAGKYAKWFYGRDALIAFAKRRAS